VDYILATKFYNEQNQLPGLIANIAAQAVPPKTVVFLDDGSVDSSAEIAAKEATSHGLEFRIVSMPVKKKGNLDTLGRVWTKAQPLLKELSKNVEYFATLDVDTRVEPSYFKDMISYLETHPSIGVVAGQAQHQPKRTFPMFAGKVFRSAILNSIDEYWDISIDSFINVKALKMGYKLSILDGMKVETPISHLQTKKGKFRAGRLAFYSGSDLLYVLTKGILLHDAQYLRGYWSESSRGTWRCQDEEILEFFSGQFKRRMLNYVKKALRL
jgi:cellulose synthase/poly-beta-1,6-N-acetylglucosamine synthase-like glycosyltransferase